MNSISNKYHRRSIRLKGYDYSQEGFYYITICCQDKICRFGNVKNDKMILNDVGNIANNCWREIPNHFPNVILHEYIIMPNHIHGIIQLTTNDSLVVANNYSPENHDSLVRANNYSPLQCITTKNIITETNMGAKNVSPLHCKSPSQTIGSIIRGYKIGVTKWVRQNTDIYNLWQRNYHEHIIRNTKSYQSIVEYIVNNPVKWQEDEHYM